jgi:hypothetical protein
MRSRASSFTAVTARNRFVFFLPAIALFESPGLSRSKVAGCLSRVYLAPGQRTACAHDFVQ